MPAEPLPDTTEALARWGRLEEIFNTAVGLDRETRSGYLNEACQGDEVLRSEVEALLDVDGHTSEVLDPLVNGIQTVASTLADELGSHLVGTQIGGYRLTEVLGRGGMGVVYLAVREDGIFEKPVALKLIKRGMDTDEVVRRFQQERQILSRLDHPHIARLLDGGTASNGSPYFVMERIEGEPITLYARKLPLRGRLELFRQVCDAVDFAHRHLVIHRDLKPGNILVTANGMPKLLDFGIAKLLTPDDAGQTSTSEWRLFTPEYASPEQTRGEPVGIATDVYSLGTVLRDTVGAEPPGEISQIVRKARHELAERRYTSAARMSDDLERYLQGKTISARPDTVWYRAAKFTTRNKLPVAISLIALASLIAAVVTSTSRARQLRQEAEQVRTLSTTMLFELNEEVRLLPGSVKARERLVKTGLRFLDDAASKIGNDPKLEWELARAYERIGSLQGGPHEAQANLGDIDGSRQSHLSALRLTNALAARDPNSERLKAFQAALHDNLGRLADDTKDSFFHFGESLRLSTELQDRNGIEQARLGLALAHLASGDPATAMGFLPRKNLAHTWETKVMVLKAVADLKGALAVARAGADLAEGSLASARDAPSRRFAQGALARAHAYIGEILGEPNSLNLGDRPRSLRELKLAARLAEDNSALEPDDVIRSDLGSILVRLAGVVAETSPRESVELYQRAIVATGRFRKRDLLRREQPDVLATAHWRIAWPLHKLGRDEEAARHITRSFEVRETAPARNALGDLRLALGDRAGALAQYQRALAIAEAEVAAKPSMMPLRRDLADTLERIARWHGPRKP